MNLSISHIAWPMDREGFFLKKVSQWGCSGLEVAPSRIWDEPVESNHTERMTYKQRVNDVDLEIVSLHSLLYARQDLGLFKSKEVETETIAYLQNLCRLSADLGARILVFGSPANRRRKDILLDKAFERAAAFFFKVGRIAAAAGVCLCIEPLGKNETDFITSAFDGLKLVEMTNSPGFGLHLDAKALTEEDNFIDVLEKTAKIARHFHISEPELAPVGSSSTVDHKTIGKLLRGFGYNGYVSVEMRSQPDCENIVRASIDLAKKWYITL